MSKSILHILNAKINKFIPIIYNRETEKFKIYYEQKVYAIHKLIVKINKDVDIKNDNLDINVNVYNRLTIKTNKDPSRIMLRPDIDIDKTIAMRITKTKYPNLPPKIVDFLQIYEKHTRVGAVTHFIPKIEECGLIVKENTTCYKVINVQKANTHWLKTIAIVKPSNEAIKIGKLIIVTSLMNDYEKDIYT